jgi:DNA-binding NarL/FixJ family response regulator
MTYSEIGRQLGVSNVTVRNIEQNALSKMRAYLESKGLSLESLFPEEGTAECTRAVLDALPKYYESDNIDVQPLAA